MPDGVLAAWVEQAGRGFRPESFVPLLFGWPAEKQEPHVLIKAQAPNQLEVAVLSPLLQWPTPACSRIEADDGRAGGEAYRFEVGRGARALFVAKLEHVTVRPTVQAEYVGHPILVGRRTLTLDVVEQARF